MAITINHHALAFAFGILGNIISFFVFLAPVPTFYRIFKRKSTESFQCLPYLMALFSSMLWMYYAMLKGNAFLLITINAIGCVIETVYIVMFITYAPVHKRISAFKLLISMNLGVFALIFLVTHFLLKGNVKVSVLGWICVCFSVSVFAAPLMIMARVIRTKSVEFMPFTLSFFLTISAVMWFGYGLLLKDIWIAIPNIIGFMLGLVQMMLYVFYKNAAGRVQRVAAAAETGLSELPTTVKNIVIFKTVVGGDDVLIPVEIQRYVTNNEEIKEDEAEVVDEAQTEDQEKSFEISSGIQEDESPV